MIVGESALKDAYRRVVWGPGRIALEALPPPWEARAVRAAGRAAAVLRGPEWRRVRANLGRAFPERSGVELDRLAHRAYQAHFSNQYASFSFPGCTADTWPRYLGLVGRDRLDAALAQGHGAVLAHPHMGPAQLPTHVLGLLGHRVVQVGGGEVAVPLSSTGRWAAGERARLERRIAAALHDGRRFLRPLLRALGEGAVVMTAADATGGGDEIGRRVVRTVLGQRMRLPVGPIWLAWRSGAPLLAVACVTREVGLPFAAEIGDEIAFDRDQGSEAAMESGANGLARWLDATLRAHPGDWLFWDEFEPGALIVGRDA